MLFFINYPRKLIEIDGKIAYEYDWKLFYKLSLTVWEVFIPVDKFK